MKLTVIGSGTGLIKRERSGPSFLISEGEERLLLDCGWGCLGRLLKTGENPNRIDNIFISHPHADHIIELMAIIQSKVIHNCYFEDKISKTTVWGYKGIGRDYQTLKKMMVPEQEEKLEVETKEEGGQAGKMSLTIIEVGHVPYFRSAAIKIESGGKILVYSGDTNGDESFWQTAKGADTLIMDASVGSKVFLRKGRQPTHTSPQQAGLLADRAGVKRLILFSLYDFEEKLEMIEAAAKYFKGEIVYPSDLDQFEI